MVIEPSAFGGAFNWMISPQMEIKVIRIIKEHSMDDLVRPKREPNSIQWMRGWPTDNTVRWVGQNTAWGIYCEESSPHPRVRVHVSSHHKYDSRSVLSISQLTYLVGLNAHKLHGSSTTEFQAQIIWIF